MLLAVRISSYGCTWVVWRALKKLELLPATPRATLTYFSCFPNFPHASITRYMYEQILNSSIFLGEVNFSCACRTVKPFQSLKGFYPILLI